MKMFQIAFKLCCMRLSCVHFCKLKKYKSYHFCDSRLHVLLPCKQPQIEIFSKKFQSKKKHATGFHFQHLKYLSLATIENRLPINKLLLFEIVMVLSDPCQFQFFQPKYGKLKDARCILLKNNPKGHWSSNIIANDQLRDTPAYLLSLSLEIVSVVAR